MSLTQAPSRSPFMPAGHGWHPSVGPSLLERGLFAGGLAAIALHLLDRAFAGPATSVDAVLAIVAVPAVLVVAQPWFSGATRVGLPAALGMLAVGIGGLSDVLGAFTVGPAWSMVSGWLFAAGGVALYGALYGLHAPRLPVGSLGVRHLDVTLTAGGDRLAAWYVPSRNGAAVVLVHGASGNRSGVADRARVLARHGYGVLAFDLPGHGDSRGRAHMLGWTAQRSVDAAVRFLLARPEVDPSRIGAFGVSLGGEVLLEAAARDARLRAVVADGAGVRSMREQRLVGAGPVEEAVTWTSMQLVRGIGGTRPPAALDGLAARIAPRPVLLIAGGRAGHESELNRVYARRGSLWVIPEAGHTGGLSARPGAYERRVVAFLDRGLG